MVVLETERLVLRNFRLTDWRDLYDILSQYESSGLAIYDHPWPSSPEKIREMTEWFGGSDSYLAVCLKDGDKCIGFVALNQEAGEDGEDLNLGYIFNFDYHGKGYATEACQAALDYAFNHLQAQRVVSGTAAANRASCRLLERIGFSRVGESIASFRSAPDGTPIQFTGYTYRVTREQWQSVARHPPVG